MQGAVESDKLLPLLQVQEADQHPDDAGGQEEDAAFDDDAFPDDRQEVAGDGEGIEEDVPEGALDQGRVAEDQQGKADDNHQDGSPVAAAGDGGEHEGEVPEKENREHQLRRHLEGIDGIEQQRSQPGEDDQDREDRHIDHQQADTPYLIFIVGDAEKDFQYPAVLVVLDAEHGRIEHQQDAGEHQEIIDQALVDLRPVPGALEHEIGKEKECRQEEPNEFPGKDDLQVIFNQAGQERYELFQCHNLIVFVRLLFQNDMLMHGVCCATTS